MEEWKQYRLGDIISISSGLAYKGEHLGKGDSFLLGMGCVSYTEQFLEKGMRKYDGAYDERYSLKAGDIVLATRQQSDNLPILGMPAIIPQKFHNQKMVFGTNLYKVNLNSPDFSNSFLYWLLKTPNYIHHIKSCQTGTTVRMITKANIEDYTFFCPEKSEREKICKFLWNIENKIALNRRINDNLEQQAQTLFKSWLVDFDPFKNGKFVESEMGMIPEGWKVISLQEYCQEITRGNIPTYVEKSNRPILNQKVNKGVSLEKQYYKYNSENVEVSISKMAHYGDVLLNSLGQGTLGRVHLYKEKLGNVIIDQFITILRTNLFVKSAYLSYTLNRPEYQTIIEGNVTGSTGMWVLTINNVRNIKIIVPKESCFLELAPIINSIYQAISNNTAEMEQLCTLRDCILPHLMSGELKINDLNC